MTNSAVGGTAEWRGMIEMSIDVFSEWGTRCCDRMREPRSWGGAASPWGKECQSRLSHRPLGWGNRCGRKILMHQACQIRKHVETARIRMEISF